MRALLFHGGPGFNANPERSLFLPDAKSHGIDLILWDEPSMKRPGGPQFRTDAAFQNYMRAAEDHFLSHSDEPVTLIGHSFGSFAVAHLSHRHPDRVRTAVFICPVLSLRHADVNMFTIARDDFREHQDPLAEELDEVLSLYSGRFDQNTVRGMHLILLNPRFFSYYWHNQERMSEYMPLYEEPYFGVDLESFFRVRETVSLEPAHTSPVTALAVFGAHDVVVSEDAETDLLRERFQDLSVVRFDNSAHYPHIEETRRFLDLLT